MITNAAEEIDRCSRCGTHMYEMFRDLINTRINRYQELKKNLNYVFGEKTV